jgi:hypothetical protein
MNAFNWKFITPLALVVLMVTAVVEKLPSEFNFALSETEPGTIIPVVRMGIHLMANGLIALGAVALLRSYAASVRRRLEAVEKPQVTRPEPA